MPEKVQWHAARWVFSDYSYYGSVQFNWSGNVGPKQRILAYSIVGRPLASKHLP